MPSKYSGLYLTMPMRDSAVQSMDDYERMMPILEAGGGYVMHRARMTAYNQVWLGAGPWANEYLDQHVAIRGEWNGTMKPPVARVIFWDDLREHLANELMLDGSGLKAAMVCARKEILYETMCREYTDGDHFWERSRDGVIPKYVGNEWHRIAKRSRERFAKAGAVGVVDGKVIRFDPDRAAAARSAYLNARMDALPIDGGIHAMLTITLPPVYHRLTTWDGTKKHGKPRPNIHWNRMMPQEAMDELRKVWRKTRAMWAKSGMRKGDMRAVRFVEPHGDGTPHMHVLLSVKSVAMLDTVVKGAMYQCFTNAGDSAEFRRSWVKSKHGWQWQYTFKSKSAALARNLLKVDVMQDAAGASRYVSKYVAKHSDGDLTNKIKQWLSVCNIRQYAFIGGGMTKKLWDALGTAGLRVKSQGRDKESGELYDDWRATELMQAGSQYCVVDTPRDCLTHKWELRKYGVAGTTVYRAQRYNVVEDVTALKGADAPPWSGLAKCNPPADDLFSVGGGGDEEVVEWMQEGEYEPLEPPLWDLPNDVAADFGEDWEAWLTDCGPPQ